MFSFPPNSVPEKSEEFILLTSPASLEPATRSAPSIECPITKVVIAILITLLTIVGYLILTGQTLVITLTPENLVSLAIELSITLLFIAIIFNCYILRGHAKPFHPSQRLLLVTRTSPQIEPQTPLEPSYVPEAGPLTPTDPKKLENLFNSPTSFSNDPAYV